MSKNFADAPPFALFITMGCAKNEVDTRDMQSRLADVGIKTTDDICKCDIVIVNTCSFIQSAVEESIDAVLDVINDDRIFKNRIPVIVAGCMPSRYGKELENEIPEAASFVPCSMEDDIAEIAMKCLHISGNSLGANAISDVEDSADGPFFAYVKISDGCDRFCSYCMIPHIRGRYHSFAKETIRAEVEELSKNGVKEIILIGQDTGIWGRDLEGDQCLADLLAYLARSFSDLLFRVMYTQPENISDKLLDVISKYENIASYLDIPLQHCNEHILDDMNRKGSSKEFLALIRDIRRRVPDIAIRTTLMVGFPGESDRDFEELVSFVEEAEFEYVGLFSYSREDGTRAALLSEQVDESEKEFRLSRLRDIADSVSNSVIAKRIGSYMNVLVEGREEDGQLFGRSSMQAPEVDGITFVDQGKAGSFLPVEIEDTLFYDMEGVKA